ncbi:hypothetical protein D3C81_2013200 [compost metagenome]
MGCFPAGLLRGHLLEGFVEKLLAGLAADEAAVGGIASDKADAGSGGWVKPTDLSVVANVGFTSGAAKECETDYKRK